MPAMASKAKKADSRHGARPFDPIAMRQEARKSRSAAVLGAALAHAKPVRPTAALPIDH